MNPKHAEAAIVNTLQQHIKESKGVLSPEDLAAETGFELYKIKDALGRLLEIYQARVTMNEDTGALLFKFEYPLKKHGSKSFSEHLASAGKWIWNVFKKVYKAAIGIVLIVYAVVFALILIAIMLRGGDDRDGGGIGDLIGGIFSAIFHALSFATWHSAITYDMDDYGHHYRKFKPDKNKGKNFIQSIFSFVFGPERPKYDPLDDAKEAAAFIRENVGRLTAGHIVALSGVDYDEAERRLADYAVRFQGDLQISEDGTVIGDFREMLNKGSSLLEGGKIEFYQDEIEPPYEITGNGTGRNVFIIFLNIFNMIMSGIILNFLTQAGIENIWITFLLGIFPFIFSGLFFLVPILRTPYILSKRKKREWNIMRKDLVGAFIKIPGEAQTLTELMQRARVDNAKREIAGKVMEELIIDLDGELEINPDGEPTYRFPRLSRELKQ